MKTMTDWLKGLGMKVIKSKTECCIFYKNDTMQKTLIIGETEVTTSHTINNWVSHLIANCHGACKYQIKCRKQRENSKV